jgi:pimeloyl-ACP methyl ester carboxylesterase
MPKTSFGLLLIAAIASAPSALMAQPAPAPSVAPSRPQLPVPPFPYRAIEVAYDNPDAPGVRLAGTLTVPSGKGPFPAVLLITGSGRQDRDQSLFGHKPFLVLADYLTRRGIAVLRVDDRGVGGSTGGSRDDTSNDFATDVRSGVRFLKTRPEIAPGKIGLLGHSEGGLIAPIAAKDNADVAFAILWAGPALKGGDLLVTRVREATEKSGATPETVEAETAKQRALVDAIVGAGNSPDGYDRVLKLVSPDAEPTEQARQEVRGMTGAWFRNFLSYDPVPTLRALRIPVLALDGSKDVQVPASQNIPALKAALSANPRATVTEVPGLNHFFQTAGTGGLEEYAVLTETVSPVALKMTGDWIARVTR